MIFLDEAGDDAGEDGGALLYSWVTYRIFKYLDLVKVMFLCVYEGGVLVLVYEYCEYCGMSLVCVGLDTRSLLRFVFGDAAMVVFDVAFVFVGDDFECVFVLVIWMVVLFIVEFIFLVVKIEVGDNVEGLFATLVDYVSFVVFVNGVFLAYNEF